jgi:hypothetical protein
VTTLPSVRNAGLVARVEMRRSWRKLRANPGRLALLALAMVFPALIVVAAPFGAYFLGRTLRGGGLSIPLRPIRGFGTSFVLLGVVGNCYRVLQQSGDLGEREGLLTTIPARDAVETSAIDGTLVTVFEGFVSRPALAVARKTWLRARRAPITLSYVLYPAFVFVVPLQNAVRTGVIPPTLPALVAIYCAWMTGAAFALNPIGDEAATLPVTLIAPASGARLVRGKVLPGIAIGVPATAIATAITGVLSPLGPVSIVGLVVAAVACGVGGVTLAAGVGAAFPRFGSVNVTGNREAVVPSLTAFVVFSIGLFVLALPGLVAGVPAVASGFDVSRTAVTAAGSLLTGLLLGVAGWIASRYAARTIDSYTL